LASEKPGAGALSCSSANLKRQLIATDYTSPEGKKISQLHTRQEKISMKKARATGKAAQSQATHALLKSMLNIPDASETITSQPKVLIKGDIRLRVAEPYAARRPVKGRYQIDIEGLQEPLHVLWMIEGHVLSQTVHALEVAFDVRGTPAGATLTRQLTAQVTESGGHGCIVSSVFVQIVVVHDELTRAIPWLNQTSL
jgi:hypothetical protein